MRPLSTVTRGLASCLRGRIPGQLVIQLTDHCNARCPQCGMRSSEGFPRSRLSTQAVRKLIDAAAEKGVQALSFTGGEVMLRQKELTELICYAGEAGIPFLRTGTNGFFLTGSQEAGFESRIERIAENLAATPLRNFWISLDSAVPSIHEAMRGFPGVVAGIEKALPIFHRHGLYPSVNLGINRNITEETGALPPRGIEANPQEYAEYFYELYQNGFRAFYRFVIDLGFTIVNSCYPMSIEEEDPHQLNAVYAASSADRVVSYTHFEKTLLFRALSDTLPEFRSRIRIFSPRTSLYALSRQYEEQTSFPAACRGGIDFFFINARDGMTYPCGYRGNENLGDFSTLNLRAITDKESCRQCDWECFRDPSELFSPLLQARSAPIALLRKLFRDPEYRRLWLKDLNYYRACNFFDGRTPLNSRRLQKFLI